MRWEAKVGRVHTLFGALLLVKMSQNVWNVSFLLIKVHSFSDKPKTWPWHCPSLSPFRHLPHTRSAGPKPRVPVALRLPSRPPPLLYPGAWQLPHDSGNTVSGARWISVTFFDQRLFRDNEDCIHCLVLLSLSSLPAATDRRNTCASGLPLYI